MPNDHSSLPCLSLQKRVCFSRFTADTHIPHTHTTHTQHIPQTVRIIGLDIAGVDLLIDNNTYRICEVSVIFLFPLFANSSESLRLSVTVCDGFALPAVPTLVFWPTISECPCVVFVCSSHLRFAFTISARR